MPWETSERRAGLPPDWAARRARCLKRADYRCEWRTKGVRCHREATDADHRRHRDNHDDLQALCSGHHKMKTMAEARAAKAARYSARRTPEPHPGML